MSADTPDYRDTVYLHGWTAGRRSASMTACARKLLSKRGGARPSSCTTALLTPTATSTSAMP